MWVKICGTTNLEDALDAVAAGADALGFIFAPSPRRVSAEQVCRISGALPQGVERFGVFVDASAEEIAATVQAAKLSGVQLHGSADTELAQRVREQCGDVPEGNRLRIIQGLHFIAGGAEALDVQLAALAQNRAVNAVLVDSRSASKVGGTGVPFDWPAAQRSFARSAPRLRLIAAGGLSPENVGEAIAMLSPWGVDVVTGVEASPGRKDPRRVRAFVQAARAAFVSCERDSGVKQVS